VSGARKEHVFSFARQQGTRCALVAVPRLLTRLITADQSPCGLSVWQDTVLQLPDAIAQPRWLNVFTGEFLTGHLLDGANVLPVHQMFAHFPVALLVAQA